ncbi:MAG: hypothetical protein RLZ92_1186 [Pseudomonadota bacterium]|jgi:hypothetical protein
MKTRFTQVLIFSLLINTTGCAFHMPFWDDSDETEQTASPESIITPAFSTHIAPPSDSSICEAQCTKYGGLKKKFCKKKCESKLKKERK